MTAHALDTRDAGAPPPRPRSRGAVSRVPGAAAAVVLVACLVLWSSPGGQSRPDAALFAGYVLVGVVLPGTLLWRLCLGRRDWPLAVDVLLGAGLGTAVELLAYLPARMVGAPRLFLLVPLVVVALSLTPHGRRRCWYRSTPVPWWWAWVVVSSVLVTVLALVREGVFARPTTAGAARFDYIDVPYHLALIGELRHHLPADVPMVLGEPLHYHWFFHADVAAASWATGLSPYLLLTRLAVLPMIVAAIGGAAAAAWVLTRSWRAAAVAPVALAIGGGTSLLPGSGEFFTSGVLVSSPTTTLAQALLPIAVVTLVGLLEQRLGRGAWVAAAVLVAALAGAKGTVLPVVLAGLLAAGVLHVRSRAVRRSAAGLLALVVVAVLISQQLVYGRASQGLALDPFLLGRGVVANAGLPPEVSSASGAGLVGTTVWLLGWSGIAVAGVLLLRRFRASPGAVLLLGCVAAGLGATALLSTGGSYNQLYFARVVPPVAAIAAACGAAVVARRSGRRWGLLAAGAAVGAGAGVLWGRPPPDDLSGFWVPWLLLLAVAVVLSATTLPLRGPTRPAGALVALGLVTGLSAGSAVGGTVGWLASGAQPTPWRPPAADGPRWVDGGPWPFSWRPTVAETAIARPGGIEAARWIEARSGPDDVLATSQHCRLVAEPATPTCDHRAFWLAGHAERRVLVEGWAYTTTSIGQAARTGVSVCCVPFSDPARLAANDAAFTRPDRAVLARLRTTYGVRWLVVDTVSHPAWRAPEGARVVHRSGDYLVVRLT